MAANSAEGGQAHIVDCVLRAGRTLIVGVLTAEWGGGTLGAVAHLLTSYLGPLTFVTCPRPLLIHCLIFPTHSHGHHTRYHWLAVYEPALGPDLNGHPLVTPQYVSLPSIFILFECRKENHNKKMCLSLIYVLKL